MTADLAAPPQTRPPHIPREWWYRATWHARQQAINAHLRATRAAEEAEHARIQALRATVEAARAEHDARYHPTADTNTDTKPDTKRTTEQIVATIDDMLTWAASTDDIIHELGMTPGALEMRMKRAGCADLSRMFQQVRNAARYKPCPDCGKNIANTSTYCRNCYRTHETRAA